MGENSLVIIIGVKIVIIIDQLTCQCPKVWPRDCTSDLRTWKDVDNVSRGNDRRSQPHCPRGRMAVRPSCEL